MRRETEKPLPNIIGFPHTSTMFSPDVLFLKPMFHSLAAGRVRMELFHPDPASSQST
jgi:hypothetical protein